MYCVYLGRATATEAPGAGSVGTSQLAADAVNGDKIADDSISDEHLDPTAITGQTAETTIASDDLILLSDTSASGALKKMTQANFVSGVGGTNTPAFEVRLSAEQSLSDAVATKAQFNTEDFDTDSAYDNSSNYRFTVPSGKAGKYFFYTCINGGNSADSTTDYINVYFYKNGSSQGRLHPRGYNNAQMLYATTYTKSFDLSAGDYIEVYVMVDTTSGSPKITSGGDIISNFGGYKLLT
jgi:hypothetical protein